MMFFDKSLNTVWLILLISIAIYFISYVFFEMPDDRVLKSDYIIYINAADIVLQGSGDKLYEVETQVSNQGELLKSLGFEAMGFIRFALLPFLAVIFIPFLLFGLVGGYKFFIIFIWLVLVWIIVVNRRAFKVASNILLSSILVFLFVPNVNSVLAPQISPLLTVLLISIYIYLKKKKDFVAGICAGLLLIKPQYFIAAPFIYFFASKKRKFVNGLGLVVFILVLTSLFITGLKGILEYPNFILSTENPIYGSRPWQMFSLSSFMTNIGIVDQSEYLLVGVINLFLYIAFLYIFYFKSKIKKTEELFASLVVIAVSLSYHAINHDLTILLLPIFILLDLASVKLKGVQSYYYLILAVVLYLSPLMFLSENTALGSFAIFIVGLLLLGGKTLFKKLTVFEESDFY
jgi:hypothetical protein